MPTRKRKDGRYEVQGSERGERFHRILPQGAKRKEANELERKLRREIFNTKELGHAPQIPLGNAILRYLEEYQGKARPDSHARALEVLVRGKPLSVIVDVAASVAREHAPVRAIGKKGITNSTRNRRIAVLRRVASLAYRRWGWLKEPLHEKIEMLPENPARTVYLSRGELAALVLRVRDRECRKGILMAAFTGMRRSELLGLEPDDIRGNVVCLTDTKTSSPRNIPIVPSIAWAFKRLPLAVDPTRLSKSVQKASEGKVRFHDLRHSCASFLANEGVPEHIIGAILGHKSRQTTKRYSHLNTSTLEQAMVVALKSRKEAA